MPLINCPECDQKVSNRAEICPHCGVAIAGTTEAEDKLAEAETEAEKAETEARKKDSETIGGSLVVAAIAFGLFIWWFTSDSDPSVQSDSTEKASRDDPSETTAWVMCEEFVKDRLKSPGSAEFPRYAEGYVEQIGRNTFEVNAYVDSQNSFGAQLRTNFTCLTEYIGDGEWRRITVILE